MIVQTALAELEQLQSVESATALVGVVDQQLRNAGFEHWMYALDLPAEGERRRQYMLSGYPGEWVTHYFQNDYLQVDPVIAHCRSHASPFVWPTDGTRHGDVSEPAARMFDEAGSFGLRSGISIPVHGLGCTWGLVSLATARKVRRNEMRQAMASLHLFAHCLHEVARRHAQEVESESRPRLTQRELECLRWAAVGKTSWEIGKVLSISERTAVFHLQNAAGKLGAMSRQAAIVRAITLGLISP